MDISEFKAQNPAYKDVPDLELADALHAKYYSEIPRDQFLGHVGLSAPANDSFSTAMPRDAYQKQFLANNPQADQSALDMALGQYDKDAAARAQAATAAPADRFKVLQSPEAMFDARLNAKLQGKRDGVVPQLPAKMQPDNVATPAPTPSTFDTVAGGLIGGTLNTLTGAGASLSRMVGANETADDWDAGRAQIAQRQHELGGDTMTGKVAGLVGGIAPALAVPADMVSQLVANAGLFAKPAFDDTLKAKLAQGYSQPLALAHAAEAFGLNLFAPTVAARGMGALAGKLGTAGLEGLGGAAAGLGQAAVEGAGFSVANSVMDKGTDVLAGQQNNNAWVNPEDMAVQALGFGALRAGHAIASGIAGHAEPLIPPTASVEDIAQAQTVDQAIDAAVQSVPTINTEALRAGNDVNVADLLRSIRPLDPVPVPERVAEPVAPEPPAAADTISAPHDLVTTGEADAPATDLPAVDGLGRSPGDVGASVPGVDGGTGLARPDAGLPAADPARLAAADGPDLSGADRPADLQPPLSETAPAESAPLPPELAHGAAILSTMKPVEGMGQLQVVDPATMTGHEGSITPEHAQFVQALGDALGKKVVFFRQDGADKRLDGFAPRSAPDTLFVNVGKGDAAWHVVAGHEFFHQMPDDVRASFIATIKPMIAPEQFAALKQYINQPHLDESGHWEEIGADLFGNRFAEPGFFDKVLAQAKDRPAAAKVFAYVRSFLDKLSNAMAGKGFATDRYVSDLDQIRAAAAEALGRYLKGAGAPEAPPLRDTRGEGVRFHGTSREMPGGRPNNEFAMSGDNRNIYGQGFYTTDAADISHGYMKKGKGGNPTLYQVSERPGVRLYDMEQPMTPEVRKMAERAMGDAFPDADLDGKPVTTLRQLFDEYRAESQNNGITRDEAQETFDAIRYNLEQQGYNGYRHVGGMTTGKQPHDVRIYWTPEDHIDVAKSDIERFRGKAPEAPRNALEAARIKHDRQDEEVRKAAENIARRKAEKDALLAVPEAAATKNAKEQRQQMIDGLANMGTGELRTVATGHARAYMRDAAAELLQQRAEATSAKRSAAMKQRMKQDARIDPEQDHMLQAIAKLGGINRDSVQGRMRLAPEELAVKATVGNLARHVFVKNGGMRIEDAGAALADLGYVNHDEHGKHDQSDWEDKLSSAVNGDEVYTPQGIMLRADAQRAHEMEAIGAQSEAEFHTIEHYADQLEHWADTHDIDLARIEAMYPDAHLLTEEDAHDYPDTEAIARPPTDEHSPEPATEGAANDGAAPAFGLESQSRADLVGKDARANDRSVADRELADRERDAFSLSAPDGSVTGEAKAMGNSRQEPMFSNERDDAFNDLGRGFTTDGRNLLRDGKNVGDLKLEVVSEGKGPSHVVVRDLRVTSRGNGTGTEALHAVMDKAAEQGMPVALTTESMLGKAHQQRLRAYYERLGFVKNRGADRVKGIGEEYVWTPDAKSATRMDDETGLPLNSDGTVTVYHHTSAENAERIRATGTLKSAAEPDVYVTTRKEADTGYGDTAVPVRVNPARLRLDDEFPDGRRDFRMDAGKPGGSVRVRVDDAKLSSERDYPLAPRDEWYGEGTFRADGGRMVHVSPDEYINKVRPLTMDDESRENIDLLKQHIESGKTLDPLLMRADGKEDGRHRAYAAKELGIKQVPVIDYGNHFKDAPEVPDTKYSTERDTRTIEVDGERRPITDSRGKLVAQDFEGQQAFYRWFADSKVVDGDGRPLVVYHGTRTKGDAIDSFDFDKIGKQTDSGWMGRGFYFGSHETANAYAGHHEFDPDHFPQGGAIYPSYLSMEKPAVLRDTERNDGQRTLVRELLDLPDEASADNVRKHLIDAGYDGVIYERFSPHGKGYTEYVAFRPEQIKSAIGNNGEFSESNPDIRYSQARPDEPRYDGPGSKELYAVGPAKDSMLDSASKAWREVLMFADPMGTGSFKAQRVASDYERALVKSNHQWNNLFRALSDHFTPDQLREMWDAGDEQNVLMQQGLPTDGRGIDRLSPDQRAVSHTIHQYGNELLAQAKAEGMFEGEGLPYWTTRMVVQIGEDGDVSKLIASGNKRPASGSPTDAIGFTKDANSLKQRKHLTTEETEAAANALVEDGKHAVVVRDLRTNVLALARLEKAIAGRRLLNQIKAEGVLSGEELVGGSGDDFVEVNHPAFTQWRPDLVKNADGKWEPKVDQNGEIDFKPTYLKIRKDWEGPLRAVLASEKDFKQVYKAYMRLKSESMNYNMASPLIHNMVILGRAAAYGKPVLTALHAYAVGRKLRTDYAAQNEMIERGMNPIGSQGFMQDITGMAAGESLVPGRSLTSQAVSRLIGAINKNAGQATARGFDKVGDFWHGTLLWDLIGDLQRGLYVHMKSAKLREGMDEISAGEFAGHFANRFAGSVRNSAMSASARQLLNVFMFSRSFTVGNLGIVKDMFQGVPSDSYSQVYTRLGAERAAALVKAGRKEAISAFVKDYGLALVSTNLIAATLIAWQQDDLKNGVKNVLGQYRDNYLTMLKMGGEHWSHWLDPWFVPDQLSLLSANEKGRTDRVRTNTEADGTAVYTRIPSGKVPEEIRNWLTKPVTTLTSKLAPLPKSIWEAATNKVGTFDQPLYPEDAHWYEKAMPMIGHVLSSQLPVSTIKAHYDILFGHESQPTNDGMMSTPERQKAAGFWTGFTTSHGYPGGPEAGLRAEVERNYREKVGLAMPAIRDAIKHGDAEKAEQLMDEADIPQKERAALRRRIEVPATGKGQSQANRKFNQHASDEERDRMDMLRQQR